MYGCALDGFLLILISIGGHSLTIAFDTFSLSFCLSSHVCVCVWVYLPLSSMCISISLDLSSGLFINMNGNMCALRCSHKHFRYDPTAFLYAFLLDPKLTNSVRWNRPKSDAVITTCIFNWKYRSFVLLAMVVVTSGGGGSGGVADGGVGKCTLQNMCG